MITNIIATVIISLVTNVISADNAVWGPDYSRILPTNPAQTIVTPATERYETTEIRERTVVQWQWQGKDGQQILSDKLLSSVTKVMRLRQEWEDAGKRTNATDRAFDPTPFGGTISIGPYIITNMILVK